MTKGFLLGRGLKTKNTTNIDHPANEHSRDFLWENYGKYFFIGTIVLQNIYIGRIILFFKGFCKQFINIIVIIEAQKRMCYGNKKIEVFCKQKTSIPCKSCGHKIYRVLSERRQLNTPGFQEISYYNISPCRKKDNF